MSVSDKRQADTTATLPVKIREAIQRELERWGYYTCPTQPQGNKIGGTQ